MAEVIWTTAAVQDVERIVAYINFENPVAADALRKRIYVHVQQLCNHPKSGSVIPELRRSTKLYRQLVEPPCRIFYRISDGRALILNVIRGEMRFSKRTLLKRFRDSR